VNDTDETQELRKSWQQEIENNRALAEKIEKLSAALRRTLTIICEDICSQLNPDGHIEECVDLRKVLE
jgi:hypothetical protein